MESKIPASWTLKDGRVIAINSISQWRTYEGLMDGMPGPFVNGIILHGLLDREGMTSFDTPRYDTPSGLPDDFTNEKGKPYLVPPKAVPAFEGEGALLPRYICSAVFESDVTKNPDPNSDYSKLRVIWLQNDFAFPVDPSVVVAFQDIDWETFAEDAYDF